MKTRWNLQNENQDGFACYDCGELVPEGLLVCPHCGAELSQPESGVMDKVLNLFLGWYILAVVLLMISLPLLSCLGILSWLVLYLI